MAKLKDVLQYVAYGTALDIIEVETSGYNSYKHLFSESDLITRETIEHFYPELLKREMKGGIHAEGIRKDRLVIPLKEDIILKKYTYLERLRCFELLKEKVPYMLDDLEKQMRWYEEEATDEEIGDGENLSQFLICVYGGNNEGIEELIKEWILA
jgi:hypothetical protein